MKTRKTTKMWFLGAMATVTALCGAVALQNEKQVVSADSAFTMEMVDGASVRLVGTDATTYGIKYTAKIAKDSYNENAKYYVMIIPTGWLTTYNLSESYDANFDYYEVLTNAGKDASFDDPSKRTMNVMEATPKLDGDYYYFNGSITDVKYENSFREFFGIAYMEVGDVRTYAEFETGENKRSISQVASAALNDKTNNWTTDEKASLITMVEKAYKAYNDSDHDYDTVEDIKLPTIDAQSADLSLVSGDTHQIDTLVGVPEGIGVKVEYTSSSPAQVTVSESGMLTANTVGSGATITATVLGEDYEVAQIAPVENMLVGFDTKASEANIMQSTTSEWQESFEGRNGVVKTATTSGGAYGNYKVKLYFDVNKAYMEALDFDYISIWVWIDEAGAWDVRSHEHSLATLAGQSWQEIRIYQEEIITARSSRNNAWVQNFGVAGARNAFNSTYAKDTKDGFALDHLFQIRSTANGDPKTVYIDSVSYVKFESNGEDPTTTGEYTLPTVTMSGTSATPEISVKQGTNALTVEDGLVNLSTVGVYTIDYAFDYNGLTYAKTDNVKIATGFLEDFSNSSTATLYSYQGTSGTHYADSTALSLLGDRTGVVGNELTCTANTYLQFTFNKTADELKEILCADENGEYAWDYITIDICVTRSDNGGGWIYVNKDSNQAFGWQYNSKTWKTITLTMDQIVGRTQESNGLGATSIWGYEIYKANGNKYPANAAAVIEKFCEMHSRGSSNASFLMIPSASINGIYIDSVSIGKNV